MKQVIQNFKSGKLYVDEVPVPSIHKGMVLVANKFSLISAGTEKSTVKIGKANLLGKAQQRPDLVAQVIQNIKKEGLNATINKVQTKLDSPKALGYSTSGTVLSSMDSDSQFKPGDRVACAGQDYASHAELVAVPQNLVAKIPENVSFEEASFTTLGAIALQGVRQAAPTIGQNICVIGLGLLGQLTCQLLRANGCNVFGIDISDKLVSLAKEISVDCAVLRNDKSLLIQTESFTRGHGFDAVIITAATRSNDPIELSAEIARKKGKIVVVGSVKMDVPRDPHFYRKELDLKMSCSYGPGRYDVNYEEKGYDYPYAYVRWTEKRNMEAFLSLLSKKTLNVQPLITHVFDITQAEQAYDIVLGKTDQFYTAVLLKYTERVNANLSKVTLSSPVLSQLNVGFIGAGSFAQNYLIPYVKKENSTSLHTVTTLKGITSKNVANKFGFSHASSNQEDVLSNDSINTVFIATPHNSHAELVIKSIEANKHVFVEKPLAINLEELEKIKICVETGKTKLLVGFNRRFSPISNHIKKKFKEISEPKIINIRVNAGHLPKEHWSQQDDVGGGRIIGEVCHFIDLIQYFTDDQPVRVYADRLSTLTNTTKNDDNIVVTLGMSDGSVGVITYVANGDKSLPKEYIEVFAGGVVGVIENFRSGFIYDKNKRNKLKYKGKGYAEEVRSFLDSIKNNKSVPISFESIYLTTLTSFKILDSLTTGLPQTIKTN